MKHVIVFGAGASVDFGVPTMDRFIDAAEDLLADGAAQISSEDFHLFFDVIQNRFRQLHAKSTVDLNNIESVFGLVEMASLLGSLPSFDEDQIRRLAKAIRTVLVETIISTGRFSISSEGRWQPPDPYSTIAKHIADSRSKGGNPDLALITLNYDLGLDFALHWHNQEVDYGLARQPKQAVPIYKLHGSLNWVRCGECGTVRALSMSEVVKPYVNWRSSASRPTSLVVDPRRAHELCMPHCENDKAPYEIAVVPPTWNKTQYSQQLGQVWAAAAREIAVAQEITIIGYSLPDSDSFFRDLLALGFEGPTRVRAFTVVNPDESARTRFENLLGPETRSRFRFTNATFEDWAKEMFGRSYGFQLV